jgi:hypothetical protein
MNGTLSNIHVRHNVKYIASLWALDPIRDNKLHAGDGKRRVPISITRQIRVSKLCPLSMT